MHFSRSAYFHKVTVLDNCLWDHLFRNCRVMSHGKAVGTHCFVNSPCNYSRKSNCKLMDLILTRTHVQHFRVNVTRQRRGVGIVNAAAWVDDCHCENINTWYFDLEPCLVKQTGSSNIFSNMWLTTWFRRICIQTYFYPHGFVEYIFNHMFNHIVTSSIFSTIWLTRIKFQQNAFVEYIFHHMVNHIVKHVFDG